MSMCCCASHCPERCEPGCCPSYQRCDCQCHIDGRSSIQLRTAPTLDSSPVEPLARGPYASAYPPGTPSPFAQAGVEPSSRPRSGDGALSLLTSILVAIRDALAQARPASDPEVRVSISGEVSIWRVSLDGGETWTEINAHGLAGDPSEAARQILAQVEP